MFEKYGFDGDQGPIVSRHVETEGNGVGNGGGNGGPNGDGNGGFAAGRSNQSSPSISNMVSPRLSGRSFDLSAVVDGGDIGDSGSLTAPADARTAKLVYPICSICNLTLGETAAIDPDDPVDKNGRLKAYHHPGDGAYSLGWDTCLSRHVQANTLFDPHYGPPAFLVVLTRKAIDGIRLPNQTNQHELGGG